MLQPSRPVESEPFWAAYRRPSPADGPAIVDLFGAVYGDRIPESREFLLRAWRWKYGGAPLPHRSLVTIDMTDGALVAHVGGLRLGTRVLGETSVATQSVDHMCAPDYRYRRTGVPVFSELLVRWWEDGFGRGQSLFAFGFPTHKNLRVGARAADWSVVERLTFLVRPVPPAADRPAAVRPPAGPPYVEWGDRPPLDADDLWRACRDDHRIAVERDRAYLAWRYAEDPQRRYRFVAVRDASALRGLAVVGPWPGATDVYAIHDLVVPQGDAEALDRLVLEAEVAASVAGRTWLATWFPSESVWRLAFEGRGFGLRRTRFPWVARFATPDLDARDLARLTYATPGDADSL